MTNLSALFLENAVESNQVQMLHYRNDQEADLFLEGDTDLFLKEIRLYYESNRDLEPEIVILDQSQFLHRNGYEPEAP